MLPGVAFTQLLHGLFPGFLPMVGTTPGRAPILEQDCDCLWGWFLTAYGKSVLYVFSGFVAHVSKNR